MRKHKILFSVVSMQIQTCGTSAGLQKVAYFGITVEKQTAVLPCIICQQLASNYSINFYDDEEKFDVTAC